MTTIKPVTDDDVTAAEQMVEAARNELAAMRERVSERLTDGRPPSIDTAAAIAGAVSRVDLAQDELARRQAARQAWLDDQADRPRREQEAAGVIKDATKELGAARKRIADAATAAQAALVELLDAGRGYDQAVRRTASTLAARDLLLVPGEDHATGTQTSLGAVAVRIAGRWYFGLPDPSPLVGWVHARVVDARLSRNGVGRVPMGPLRTLEARADGLFGGVPPVAIDPDRPQPIRMPHVETPRTPVGLSASAKGRESRRRDRS